MRARRESRPNNPKQQLWGNWSETTLNYWIMMKRYQSQRIGWWFNSWLWKLLSTWHKTCQVVNDLMCFGAAMSAFCLKKKKKKKNNNNNNNFFQGTISYHALHGCYGEPKCGWSYMNGIWMWTMVVGESSLLVVCPLNVWTHRTPFKTLLGRHDLMGAIK